MAFKEKALRRLDEKMSKKGIPYALGGDFLLQALSLAEESHLLSLTVPFEKRGDADAVMRRLGMGHVDCDTPECFLGTYHFDGAEFQLLALPEHRLPTPDVWKKVDIPGASVCVMHPSAWCHVCRTMGWEVPELLLPFCMSQPLSHTP
ncbi:MAG: hypothetical protein IJ246_02620 [Clostridia bacterium]|nr:hypothetical protein [Clostridia bacterium]